MPMTGVAPEGEGAEFEVAASDPILEQWALTHRTQLLQIKCRYVLLPLHLCPHHNTSWFMFAECSCASVDAYMGACGCARTHIPMCPVHACASDCMHACIRGCTCLWVCVHAAVARVLPALPHFTSHTSHETTIQWIVPTLDQTTEQPCRRNKPAQPKCVLHLLLPGG